MAIEIKVPALGKSVTEATVGQWFKKPGDAVTVDEPLVELETDKVTVEVPAPVGGRAGRHQGAAGQHGRRRLGAGRPSTVHRRRTQRPKPRAAPGPCGPAAKREPAADPRRHRRRQAGARAPRASRRAPRAATSAMPPAPAARKIMEEKGLAAAEVAGSGRRGQILKEDVMAAAARPRRRRRRPPWPQLRCRWPRVPVPAAADARALGGRTMPRARSACA